MKFKYKFTTAIYVLFALMYLLGAVCLVWNIIRLIDGVNSSVVVDSYLIIRTVLCIALPIVLSIFITAMIISSYYTVGDKKLTVKFGFIGDKYSIDDVTGIIKNVKTDVLSLIFKDESTLKIVIDKGLFDDFSAELMKKNKNISYGETDETEKKKWGVKWKE